MSLQTYVVSVVGGSIYCTAIYVNVDMQLYQ